MDAPTEVSDLELALDTNKEVLGLNVPMDNVLFVEIVECVRHLRNILCGIKGTFLVEYSSVTEKQETHPT